MAANTNKNNTKSPPNAAFTGTQLSLFQSFLCNTNEERARLSNTIELWDGVPKYFVSRQEMTKHREKGLLPTLERDFQYKNRSFTVRIRPARLTDENRKDKEFYPSAREELVEDALRKIGAEQNCGFLDTTDSGVVFTLHILRRELKRQGHTLSYQQVVESLDVMVGCLIKIQAKDGRGDYQSPILSGLIRVSQQRRREDPTARWIAYFNPLVTQSIRALTFRQYNYHAMMSHTTQLARWIHKRLAHNYVNANILTPYTVRFSSIQRDSGLLEYKRQRDAVRKLDEALEELRSQHVLSSFKKEEVKGERNRILNVSYTLSPTHDFVKQIKAANRRQSNDQKQIFQS